MVTKKQYQDIREKTLALYEKAHIALTQKEKESIEMVDEGLGDIYNTGLQIITYVNTERCCAKEMVLLPNQTCPEHMHPPVDGKPGKEETFRCRYGVVYLYTEGEPTKNPKAKPPKGTEMYYKYWHETILHPGDQYTIFPNTFHWFQGGEEGAVVSEFSTKSMDETDVYSNPNIKRITEYEK